MSDGRFVLVGTARNEGPYILEWVAHHLLVGFQKFVILQNNSDDTTNETLKCLAGLGIVNYKYNHAAKPGSHQIQAYRRASRQPEYLASEWAMALDLDEFLCIKVGAGRLVDWLPLLPGPDLVHVNWRRFGSAGRTTIADGLVTETFTRAEHAETVRGSIRSFKSFYRTAKFERPGAHKPKRRPEFPDPRISNGSGVPAEDMEILNFRCTDPEALRYAQVNHYQVRDAGSYVLKSDKGAPTNSGKTIGQKYWRRRNKNALEDRLLADRAPRLRAKMRELDAMSGGRLMALRAEGIAQHRAKLDALLTKPHLSALYDYCVNQPMM